MAINLKGQAWSARRKVRAALFGSSLFILAFLGCSPEAGSTPPPDLIAHEQMVSLVTDLTLCEATLGSEPLAAFNDTLSTINVLRDHHISEQQFLSSFAFYTQHPKELSRIYDEVLAKLENKPGNDSLPK